MLLDVARDLADRVGGFSRTALRECKALLARAAKLNTEDYERAYVEAQQRCLDARDSV